MATELSLRLRRIRIRTRGPPVREDALLGAHMPEATRLPSDPEGGRGGLTELAIPVNHAACRIDSAESGDDILEAHGVGRNGRPGSEGCWRVKATRRGCVREEECQ